MILTNKLVEHTPIINSLFEITYKGSGNNSLLTEVTESYELRSDNNILIIKYFTSKENLFNLISSVKSVSYLNILLHDSTGEGILKFKMNTKYKGPIAKQSYTSEDLLSLHIAFDISNLTIVMHNSNE